MAYPEPVRFDEISAIKLYRTNIVPKEEHETSLEDICSWPDGTWCCREEIEDYTYTSDDYIILYFNTPEYNQFIENIGE